MATAPRSGRRPSDPAPAGRAAAPRGAGGDGLKWWEPRDGIWGPAFHFGSAVLEMAVPTLYRARVAGREHLPARGGVLVIANHVHDIDPPFMAWAVRPRPLEYVAAAHNFESGFVGPLISALGAFPMRTDKPDIRGLRYALAQLELGRVVLIFPEGRPSYDEPIAPFLPGAGMLALAEGVTVVPAAIAGTNQVVDRRRIPRLRGPVGIAFGPPVEVPATGARRTRAAAVLEGARERIVVLERWLRAQLAGES